MSRGVSIGGGLLVLTTVLGGQQESAPSFRAGVNLVEVDARVFNRERQFVTTLTQDDFRVFEDGVEQAVSSVRLVDLSTDHAAPAAPVPRDGRVLAPDRGRFYLLVLDDLHTHPLRGDAVRSVARRFIEDRLEPNDRAAIVVTSGGRPYQDLTGDRAALLAAIDRFMGHQTTPFGLSGGRLESERLDTARSVLIQLRKLAEFLPKVDGRRKALIFISEGTHASPSARFDDSRYRLLESEMRDTIISAVKNNVGIYAIDPKGNPTGKKGTIAPVEMFEEDPFSIEAATIRQGLYALSAETGAVALLQSNDVNPVFDRIVSDSTQYYVLSYYGPPITGKKPTYRRIEVRLKDPALRVRARPGYYAVLPTR